MKKTRKKSLIYSTPNCNSVADFNSYACLDGKADDASIHIKSVLKDETITLGHRFFYLCAYSLDDQEIANLKVYLHDWYKETWPDDEVVEAEAFNVMRGIRSPIHKQEGLDRLLSYLEL